MNTLQLLRDHDEGPRFNRLRINDMLTIPTTLDKEALAAELHTRIRGEVRFDRGSRALYATDASNYRQVPIGLVIPRDITDVERTVQIAHRYGAPLLSRGGGTSLAGQCCNVALVMDFSKYMHRVLEIDPDRRLARAQPGCVLDSLRSAAERHHLTFGPDPATHDHCTLGGMLGNNSCGIHSLLCANAGRGLRTADNTESLEILTYDGLRMTVGPTSPEELEAIIRAGGRRGEIYAALQELRDTYADEIRRRFPRLPRRVSGYNLDELLPENGFNVARALVGTESTCVVILEATLNLVPSPPKRALLVLGYPDVYTAGDHVMDILEFHPIGLEGLDHLLVRYIREKGEETAELKLLPEGQGWLLVEFGGETLAEARDTARRCMEALKKTKSPPSMRMYDDRAQEQRIWKVRESGLGSTAFVPNLPDMWPGFEDSAVPPDRVGDYLRDLRKLFERYGYNPSLYGHLGQGCIHCRIDFDLYTAPGIKHYRAFMNDAAELVVSYGGSLSGEHGDGQSRAELLPKMYGPQLMQAFREFKSIWDPNWQMNPGKVVDAYPITENLRLSADYHPPQPKTEFNYPSDQGAFSRAALRCVGVGKCRRDGGGTMCPSFMVTHEEMHSTRGRAHLLFEMLNGEVLTEGWESEEVKEALDLCLACKGCKGECPVNVDMATYKAEFLSHYYERKSRPRSAYAFGFIHLWSRLAVQIPTVVNLVTRTPGLRHLARWVAGMDQARRIPPFAPQSFKQWFAERPQQNLGMPRVILWPDTFNDTLYPETCKAAVEVLEDAGFQIDVPMRDMCCGRPLYDYGFLDTARRWLLQILDTLRPQIQDGLPVVVLEPSCAAVFRDELVNLFPNDLDARRLASQTFLLSEFLAHHAPGYKPPRLLRSALLHGHCHHKAIMKLDDEQALLKKMGLELQVPETGCCGMAGAFGFEAGTHYDVSVQCGERVLLPGVRQATDQTVIIADGFSCREQIAQGSDRQALHLAEVLQLARRHGPSGPLNGRPEDELIRTRREARRQADVRAAGVIAAGLAALGLYLWARRGHRC